MDISVKTNIKDAVGFVNRFSDQIPFASAAALSKTAKQGAESIRNAFKGEFDKPTRYTTNSLFNTGANKLRLTAAFGLKDQAMLSKSGGGTPADTLAHHFTGGQSRVTRYELAFRKLGMLGFDEDIVPGSELIELNQFGNIPASLIVKLIAYFGGFGEQGYKANTSSEKRAKLAKRTDKSTKGKKQSKYVTINGVVYFYAKGTDHLHRGIWAKTGIHGSDVRPILMFVKRANYTKRFELTKFADQAKANFDVNFKESFAYALRTAK